MKRRAVNYRFKKQNSQKSFEMGVDMGGKVRYNRGSLSKSAFPTSTKKKRKARKNWGCFGGFKNMTFRLTI